MTQREGTNDIFESRSNKVNKSRRRTMENEQCDARDRQNWGLIHAPGMHPLTLERKRSLIGNTMKLHRLPLTRLTIEIITQAEASPAANLAPNTMEHGNTVQG